MKLIKTKEDVLALRVDDKAPLLCPESGRVYIVQLSHDVLSNQYSLGVPQLYPAKFMDITTNRSYFDSVCELAEAFERDKRSYL